MTPYNEGREEKELAQAGEVPDPLIRIMERDSIAAVIRAQAIREATWAMRIAEQAAADRRYPPGAPLPITEAARPENGERLKEAG